MWRSLVARSLWEREVPGSNPGTPIVSRSGLNGLRLAASAILVVLGLACWGGLEPSARAGVGVGIAQARALDVTAWLPYWEMSAALSSTVAGAGAITTASPYWYEVAGDSTVHYEAGAGSQSVIAALQAHHVRLVPMVTEAAGMGEFAQILSDPVRRARLVRTLVKLGSHPGFAGLDLDFENFAYDPKHRLALEQRVASLYPKLIGAVCAGLHASSRTCQVAVMAHTSRIHVYDHGDIPSWIYEYGPLAKVADRVQLMAYDNHSPGGPAGPIAPLPWVRQVIAFARSQGNAARFELGLPAYGYDWYGRRSASAILANQVPGLLQSVHARLHWDPVMGEQTLTYRQHGHRNVVWFEDTRADLLRARLAASAGFSGVAVWAAGYEQPGLWPLLRGAGA